MARRGSRVVLNRSKLADLQLALADGLLHFLHQVALDASAQAPDGAPFGEGLPDRWGAAAYVGGKKVGDVSGDGSAVDKPRAFRATGGLEGIAGFGFPGRFQETGTVHHAAQPFLSPAVASLLPDAPAIMREVVAPRLGKS